jgi:hypothetical protein
MARLPEIACLDVPHALAADPWSRALASSLPHHADGGHVEFGTQFLVERLVQRLASQVLLQSTRHGR